MKESTYKNQPITMTRIHNWTKDKTKQLSYLRVMTQLLFLIVILYLSIIAVWKGLLVTLILGATLILGRVFCGWICPYGLYMDLVSLLRRKLKVPHWTLPEKLNRMLHKLRYMIVLVLLALVVLPFIVEGKSLIHLSEFLWLRGAFRPLTILLAPLETLVIPWIPPFGALLELGKVSLSYPYVGEIMAATGGTETGLLFAVVFVALTLIASFKVRRFWCRFCPTGVSIAAVNKYKRSRGVPLLRLNKSEEKCTRCGICKRVCPVQVTEVYDKKGGDVATSMCTLCLRCIEMCPYPDCLKLQFAGKTLFKSRNWLAA
ncbi:MAG: 4Fe-4S binding protein [Candidatus Bathyarchaeota archaeon]|nr:4Fe-4S binding protein [Candidatus Bathyarchaeota archaeon]